MKQKIITIDGPSGSGKGTIALLVARELGFSYLDSGALYRCMAYFFHKNHFVDSVVEHLNDVPKITQIILNDRVQIYLGDENVSDDIRSEDCAKIATSIAKMSEVRGYLLGVQRGFYDEKSGLVCDGRDMGSVVFPDAILKVFITANLETRARRRLKQLKLENNQEKFEEIVEMMRKRDYNDSSRQHSPMECPSGAVIIDGSDMGIDEVKNAVIDAYRQVSESGL